MAQHIIDLPCIADAYCSSENPSVNYGAATVLNAGGYIGYIILGKYNRFYALAKFNWSSLPNRKRVTSVKIRAYSAKAMTGTANSQLQYNYNTKDFTENAVTFDIFGDNITGTSDLAGQSIALNAWVEFGELQDIYNGLAKNSLINYGIHFLWWDNPSGAWSADYWQVQSKENTNPPILRVTYEDVPPDAPKPSDPIGAYKDNTSVIRFAWTYNSSVGGIQKAFDLQWSTDQVTWTTVSQTIANNYYDMPANTVPSGNIYWRVRCYNEYDEVSTYSGISSFYAIGAPAAPAIQSLTAGTARPTVAWSSSSQQQIYELQILQGVTVIYDSGYQPGILTRSHKVNAFLSDGNYTVKIRIKNEYDLYSAWGESAFTVTTSKPTKPTLTLQTSAYGLEFRFTGIPANGYALLYRSKYAENSYICIGKVLPAAPEYQDNAACNAVEYKYFIRAVSVTETYQDSDIKFSQADFRYSLIAPVSDLSYVLVFNRSLNAPPKRSYERNINTEGVFYSGRAYPVYEASENISSGLSLSFYLATYVEVEELMELYDRKETVLYRDARGRKIYGTLSGLSFVDERKGYTISFVINQSDYIEALEV